MEEAIKLEWSTQKRKVNDLILLEINPRKITEEKKAELEKSLLKFGLVEEPVINTDGIIIAGNQRAIILKLLGRGDEEIDVRVPNRPLTEIEAKEYTIISNTHAGTFDFELLDIHFADIDWDNIGFDLPDFDFNKAKNDTDGEEDNFEIPDKVQTDIVEGDLFEIGNHRLLCGDSTKKETWAKLCGDHQFDLIVTDPPYNVNYEGKTKDALKIKNDKMSQVDFYAFLFGFYSSLGEYTKPGASWYVWHVDFEAHNFIQAFLDAGMKLSQTVIWRKNAMVMGRKDYQCQHEPCQPAGTMVARVVKDGRWKEHSTIEQVPIEKISKGDKVVSFGNAKIFRRGREVTQIGSRKYNGKIHNICVGSLKTRATSEHQFTIRFSPEHAKYCILYLMKKGNKWRVGICKMFNSRGFGLAVRLDQEKGEQAWVISAHIDMRSARVAEQVTSCLYGIPTTHWETGRNTGVFINRTKDDIDQIYHQIGTDKILDGVNKIMSERGLLLKYPLITEDEIGRFSRSQSRIIRACNIIPVIMQIPVPTEQEEFKWESITEATFESVVDMEVWSMDVDQYHHYIADGMVTHNCLYGWKEGAAHSWYSDRKQKTVLEYDRHFRNAEHPTMKPIPLIAYQINNSSKAGDIVGDGFLGSGTTMVAAEQLKRKCYGMELDPKYAEVIVDRMINSFPYLVIKKNGKRYVPKDPL